MRNNGARPPVERRMTENTEHLRLIAEADQAYATFSDAVDVLAAHAALALGLPASPESVTGYFCNYLLYNDTVTADKLLGLLAVALVKLAQHEHLAT